MAESKTERVHVPLSEAELAKIDDWRFAHRMPSRAEAIRELVRLGLASRSDRRKTGRRVSPKS